VSNLKAVLDQNAIRDNRVYSKKLFPEQTDFVILPSATPNSGAVGHHPFQQEIDNLVDGILYGAPVISDVPDSCDSMEMVLAIERSAASGKPVKVGGGIEL